MITGCYQANFHSSGSESVEPIHVRMLGRNVVVERLTMLFRIREVPVSNFDQETDYPDLRFCGFPQSLQANARSVP
jgi:tRNA U54 and U55 pseudouridine synthase Pus10